MLRSPFHLVSYWRALIGLDLAFEIEMIDYLK